MKRLFIFVFAVFCSISILSFSACEDNNSVANIEFEENEIITTVFEDVILTPKTVNITEPIVWEVSDNEIADVKDGTVTARNAGVVIVTARANGVSGCCKITFSEPEDLTYVSSEFSVLKLNLNESKKISAFAVTSDGKEVYDGNYSYKSTDETIVLVSSDGMVYAKGKGYVDIIVSGVARGITLISTTIRAEVSEKVEVTLLSPQNGVIDLYVSAGAEGKFATEITVEAKFEVNGEETQSGSYSLIPENDNVMVDGLKITAKKIGQCKVILLYKSVDNTEKSVEIFINIKKPITEITSDTEIILSLKNSIDLDRFGITEVLQKATINGTECKFSLSGNLLSFKDANAETGIKSEIILETENEIFLVRANIYDYALSTAEEFEGYLSDISLQEYLKHTAVLLSDIDCKSILPACGIFFAGTLDGRGYSLFNLKLSGRLFEATDGATIKNIGFVNVERIGGGGGILINDAYSGNSTLIENVYVQGVHNGISSLIGGVAGTGRTLTVKDSVFLIEFKNPVSGQGALVALGDIESGSRNYHLVSSTSSGIMLENGSTEGLYKSESSFKEASETLIEGFDKDLWTISDRMVCFKSAADKIIKTYKESTVIAAANREEKGFEIDLTKYNLDTISVTADGKEFTEYTYENGVLRVAGGKLANGKKTITVTSKNKAISFYAEVADYAVGTAEEFNAWGAYVQTNGFTGKRMILTSDVDYAGKDFNTACGGEAISRNISSCEIDGRGYTINNFGSSSGMFYSVTEVTLKNIGFANIDVHSNWGFFGRVISKMNIENVYVQGNLDLLFTHSNGGNYASDGVGVFGYYGDAETQGKNLLLKVEMSGGKYDEGEAFRYAVCGYGLQNVVGVYSLSESSNGKYATWIETPESCGIFTDKAVYQESINDIYASFNSKYWTIENGEIKLVHAE